MKVFSWLVFAGGLGDSQTSCTLEPKSKTGVPFKIISQSKTRVVDSMWA